MGLNEEEWRKTVESPEAESLSLSDRDHTALHHPC